MVHYPQPMDLAASPPRYPWPADEATVRAALLSAAPNRDDAPAGWLFVDTATGALEFLPLPAPVTGSPAQVLQGIASAALRNGAADGSPAGEVWDRLVSAYPASPRETTTAAAVRARVASDWASF